MGVYIKGMEMPKSCDVCPLIAEADDYHVCYINEQFIPWEWVDEHSAEQRHPKPSWCPLVEVPPHGRLIDADTEVEVWDVCGKQGVFPHFTTTVSKFLLGHLVGDIPPTIIDAEEGE